MSKIYKCGEIEEQAKKLLAPIQVACPDNLWEQLNYNLDEHHTSNEKAWKNSLSTPKTLGLAIGCISIIILAVWKLLPMLNSSSYIPPPVVAAKPQKPSVVKVDPPVNKPAVVAIVNTDSIAKANAAKDSIQKQTEITQAATSASVRAYWARRDSIRKRMNLLSMSSHKDSSAHTSNMPDTVVKVHKRHISNDSVASAVRDTTK